MAEQIRQKKLSPVELVEAHLARIEELNPQLNAFVQVDAEGARRQARVAEAAVRQGESSECCTGSRSASRVRWKSRACPGRLGRSCETGVAGERDAPLVARLRQAGAIILGVTNAPELLMAWETDNLLYGRTNNPWDLSRTPGGSSGGEAAAIAAGMSAGGMGSDGGGSIRVPAHFSGICGLKPTPGRIPATGHFPVSVGPFALLGVVGPMARNVGDLRVLFEVMQGPDDGDPSAAPVGLHWPTKEELKGVRVGYFEDDGRTPVTPETRAAVRTAAEALRRAGFQVEPFRPDGLERVRQLWWKLFGIAGGMVLGPITQGHEAELSPILKEFSSWAAAEPSHTGQSLLETWIERDVVRMQLFAQMRDYPVLLCPVASIPAFHHGERSWQVEGKTVKYLDAWSYTEWFNLLGTPAVVVPVGKSPEGLPIGVQIVGASVAGGVGAFCGCGIGRADRLLRASEYVGPDVRIWAGERGSPK